MNRSQAAMSLRPAPTRYVTVALARMGQLSAATGRYVRPQRPPGYRRYAFDLGRVHRQTDSRAPVPGQR